MDTARDEQRSRPKPALLVAVVLALACGCAAVAQRQAGQPAARSEPKPLRVVTFNVHLGEFLKYERAGLHVSVDRTFRRNAELRGADILGLQELCTGEGGWQLDYFKHLMSESGGKAYVATALSDPAGGLPCGRVEAIISRFPIVDRGAIQLPQVFEPRSAVWADIQLPDASGHGTVSARVYNVHLENRPQHMSWEEGRLRQIRVVLAHVEAWRATHPNQPLILLGDFNTVGRLWDPWRREATLGAIEHDQLTPSIAGYARTLTYTPHQIDWIFFNDQLALERSEVVGVWLSDHLPVVADFRYPHSS